MSPATGRDHLSELSNAVAAYLNTMSATADCLEQTYPDVGGLYRQRIHRMRSRLAFDATREAIADSVKTLEGELKDYATVTNRVLTKRSVELTRGILALGDLIEKMSQRQEYFGNHLLHFSAAAEDAAASAESPRCSEILAAQAADLRSLEENMSQEAGSMLKQMREQMMDLDRRLAGTTSTDSITGLINRREMERQMDARTLHGSSFSVLLFELSGPISDQVLKMVAARLATKFRHPEWIARWGAKEFAVLFPGGSTLAESRAAEVVPAVEGIYTLENRETVLIEVQARLLQPEFTSC